MSIRWFKPGPLADWRGRTEVRPDGSVYRHAYWPAISIVPYDLTPADISFLIRMNVWVPIDTDLDVDLGL